MWDRAACGDGEGSPLDSALSLSRCCVANLKAASADELSTVVMLQDEDKGWSRGFGFVSYDNVDSADK